jgi:hypothetical protein
MRSEAFFLSMKILAAALFVAMVGHEASVAFQVAAHWLTMRIGA